MADHRPALPGSYPEKGFDGIKSSLVVGNAIGQVFSAGKLLVLAAGARNRRAVSISGLLGVYKEWQEKGNV